MLVVDRSGQKIQLSSTVKLLGKSLICQQRHHGSRSIEETTYQVCRACQVDLAIADMQIAGQQIETGQIDV
jgi:hypothetical protein